MRLFLLVGLLAPLLSLAAGAAEPDQVARWNAAAIRPRDQMRVRVEVARFERTVKRYQTIAAARPGTVPPVVLFVLHGRESSWDFSAHPHNGDPLIHRTFHVPRGRVPIHAPPYSFEESAIDAYFVCDRLDKPAWKSLQASLQAQEAFNGLGYQRAGRISPYLWAGTTIYTRGKYVADGRFDPLAVDAQLGCATMLKGLQAAGNKYP